MDFWALLFLSFFTALSGALSPGPVLTFTIEKTLACGRRGWSVGALAILGHAAIEGIILSILLLGMSLFLASPITLVVIGIAGGTVLLIFGGLYLRDTIRGKMLLSFQSAGGACVDEEPINTPTTTPPKRENVREVVTSTPPARKSAGSYPLWKVVVGGAVISMSNPYWWLWWATIGFNLLVMNLPDLGTTAGVLAFFIGHELGDLSWYVLVCVLVFAGQQKINAKVYRIIIFTCGIFMACLGFYFILSTITGL